jgi:Helix-loop-helix DNA-binding domain
MSWIDADVPQCSHLHHNTNNFDNGFRLDPSLYDMPMTDPVLRPGMEDGHLGWNYETLDAQPASDQDSPPCDQSNYEMASNLAESNLSDQPGMYSLSTSSILPSEYQHSVPRRSSSSSSPISPVLEKQGENPGSSLDQNPSCRRALSSSATVEDHLSSPLEKRQSSTYDQQPSPRKKARKSHTDKIACHSLVEKRYRTKLNDGLGRLRDKVPSLRVIPKKSEEYAYREGQEKLDRPQASSKFDKATVVSKAIEYILYLETCNKHLSEEHVALTDCVSAIQTIASVSLQGSE